MILHKKSLKKICDTRFGTAQIDFILKLVVLMLVPSNV